jgi:predicted MFS family arabinose efflux permease
LQIAIFRVCFSIYSGWVTAATIIGVATVLVRTFGMTEPNAGLSNNTWAIIIIYVALVIYQLASYRERNPAYGAVYFVVLIGIYMENPTRQPILTNCIIC